MIRSGSAGRAPRGCRRARGAPPPPGERAHRRPLGVPRSRCASPCVWCPAHPAAACPRGMLAAPGACGGPSARAALPGPRAARGARCRAVRGACREHQRSAGGADPARPHLWQRLPPDPCGCICRLLSGLPLPVTPVLPLI